jgi:hypothetical protein
MNSRVRLTPDRVPLHRCIVPRVGGRDGRTKNGLRDRVVALITRLERFRGP